MNRRRIRQRLAVYLVMGLESHQGKSAFDIAQEALEGGITLLQLREKTMPLHQLLEHGRRIRDLCRDYHVPFIVNDRVDVAMLLDADGVHVGQEDIPCTMVRRLLGGDKIVGVSAGTLREAWKAVEDGADYLGVGAVFPTATKADAGEAIGTGLIAEIKRNWNIPQVGIGGITAANAEEVILAGADGVAVVSAITRSGDPKTAALQIRDSVFAHLPRNES